MAENHTSLDVLINNAGVFNVQNPAAKDGLDVRFTVKDQKCEAIIRAIEAVLRK